MISEEDEEEELVRIWGWYGGMVEFVFWWRIWLRRVWGRWIGWFAWWDSLSVLDVR